MENIRQVSTGHKCLPNNSKGFVQADPKFVDIINIDIARHKQFIQAIETKITSKRYAGMVKFCRAAGDFEQLEEMIEALSNTFTEIFSAE